VAPFPVRAAQGHAYRHHVRFCDDRFDGGLDIGKLRMPQLVRCAPTQYQEGDRAIIEAYVQPTFVNSGVNERVEVIRGMSLSVEPTGGGAAMGLR
jgi:hypothetical protein